MNDSAYGVWLSQMRFAKHISIRDLAQELEMPISYIENMESGYHLPNPEIHEHINELFGVEPPEAHSELNEPLIYNRPSPIAIYKDYNAVHPPDFRDRASVVYVGEEHINGTMLYGYVMPDDTMSAFKIFKDDYVIIREQPHVKNGDIVAVSIDEENIIIRKYIEYRETVGFYSKNPSPRNSGQLFFDKGDSRYIISGKAVNVITRICYDDNVF